MTLNFKEYEDLPLESPPVREVICQVRFAPLLEIAQKLPTDFQRELRTHYPDFKIRQSVGLEAGQPLPRAYEFISPNELSTASLGFNFLSLTTKEYSHWTNFIEEVEFLLQKFISSYGIILSSRIGLRYVNEITLDSIAANSVDDLLGLLNSDLSCLIVNDSWSLPRIAAYQLSIPDDENELTLRFAFVQDPKDRLVIDLDYYSMFDPPIETAVEDIREILEEFHKKIYSAFRWSIEESYIEVFNPESQ